jgi:hypothetical protein
MKRWGTVAVSAVTAFYASDSRSAIHEHVLLPTMHFLLTPEQGHRLAIYLASWNVCPKEKHVNDQLLNIKV